MERVAAIGLSLHEADVQALERLSKPASAGGPGLLRELADAVAASELILIATCNRIEVVFARESGHLPCSDDVRCLAAVLGLDETDPLLERLHLHTGRNAVRHIFRVAASLDSLLLGEDQILAQVRAAFDASRAIGLSGRLLGSVFEHAFQVGKQVRAETELGRHPLSVVAVGVSIAAERLEGTRPRVALVGAGSTGALAARTLRSAGLELAYVVNRSIGAAERLAQEHGARALTLERFRRADVPVDAIVSATSAPGYVLEQGTLLALAEGTADGRPLLAIDLAMPRDIEPVDSPRVELVDLEALRERGDENRRRRARAASQAEALVERKLDVLSQRFSERRVAAALADLQGETADVFERELAQLFTGRLERLGGDERQAVERWARGAFGRVAHVPISAMKRLAQDLEDSAEGET